MTKASIQFLKWNPLYETEKPFQIFGALNEDSADQRKSNLAWHEEQVEVQDCRNNVHEFGLDSHGFAIRRLPTFTELPDREAVIGEYLPAIKKMLQAELEDVGTVFLFDWRIRESVDQVKAGGMINFRDQFQPLLPSNYAHTDTSPISVIRRIRESFPNEAAQILRQRVRAVNVWKPLSNPVEEWPLALCDGTTVGRDDLIETDSIRQGNVSSHYYVRYNPEQKCIKQLWPVENPKPRRSIEVRTLIFSAKVDTAKGA
ncbi:methyltransferase CmcJ [Diaporthe helianthi]|uniref:Methyltransferase CmcJ n=1 Tax=Diaporthe helianthi TaxID=158607 RepID=A0A2P5HZQ3_DIAHE|nr:methyltransferase CmcJ [Diaporthe helianthi]